MAGQSKLPDMKREVELLDSTRVQGVLLTDFKPRIPHWLRRLLCRSGAQKSEDDMILTNESLNSTATVDVHLGGTATGDGYLRPPGSGKVTVERNVSLSDVHLPPMGIALVVAT